MLASNAFREMAFLVGVAAASGAAVAQTTADRTQDKVAFPAHKIVGNLYYVGTATLNSYLITTPQGHILINTNFEDTVPLLTASVEKVGFKMSDIKIILGSHAHTSTGPLLRCGIPVAKTRSWLSSNGWDRRW